ncbi:AAA-ATPase At5g17760-like [Cornus florida]|uniref:AAA-ATPase At5g17760-like n=1 Tax=Cornus florida TaxID=4283 RepID=UPI00289A3170|nr:AAA-ATPase At5g17760-like [Cornus florida]XP_059657793.1 AAA-ATPase At5g17760-like [Cornus florida]
MSPKTLLSTLSGLIPSTASLWSAHTNLLALMMLVKTILGELKILINQFVPEQLQHWIVSKFGCGRANEMKIVINEYVGHYTNEIFEDAQLYLSTFISPSVQVLVVSKKPQDDAVSVTVSRGEKITEIFEDIQLVWKLVGNEYQKTEGGFTTNKVDQTLELTFEKKYQDRVLGSFLPHVQEKAKSIREQSRVVQIHSLGNRTAKGSVNLGHPSTFETLAMDPELKRCLLEDLDKFVKGQHFYRKVGMAWKRGYLLYGPPGTGKSSLVAAMANHLKFDIYDLELTSHLSDSELKRLLLSTSNRSIVVIEDIDCTINSQSRQGGASGKSTDQMTLSGLLNVIDGLWSSCGDQRIIVFTTNHKERLDPALLRAGRMDEHIHMSYLSFMGFKTLVSNYLDLTDHHTFLEIEELLTDVEVTPAQIAEELLKSGEKEIALRGIRELLRRKKREGGVEEIRKDQV